MNLRSFHLVFITLAALTALGFGAWAVGGAGAGTGYAGIGWLSLVGGVGLVAYGVWFARKSLASGEGGR